MQVLELFLQHDFLGKVDPLISLGVTGTLLMCGVVYSLYRTRKPGSDPSTISDRSHA